MPPPPSSQPAAAVPSSSSNNKPVRPRGKGPASSDAVNALAAPSPPAGPSDESKPRKKRRHRAGRKHKKRQPSYAAPSDADLTDATEQHPSLLNVTEDIVEQAPFYRVRQTRGMSDTSLDSEVLLDHRHHKEVRPRRASVVQSPAASRGLSYFGNRTHKSGRQGRSASRPNMDGARDSQPGYDSGDDVEATDRTPLINNRQSPLSRSGTGYGGATPTVDKPRLGLRRPSNSSSKSAMRRGGPTLARIQSNGSYDEDYDVNNPPSMPGSPRIGTADPLDAIDAPDYGRAHSPETARVAGGYASDAIIDIDIEDDRSPANGEKPQFFHRRRTTGASGPDEVCLPYDQETEVGEEEPSHTSTSGERRLRRRKRQWPDITVLEEWALEEKDEREAMRVTEPELVGGRLRPKRFDWQKEIEDEPLRFTYYSDGVYETLRSHTLSGLRQLGLSFEELFRPPPVILDESSSDEEEDVMSQFGGGTDRAQTPINSQSRSATRNPSVAGAPSIDARLQENGTVPEPTDTPRSKSQDGQNKTGPRPIFWLDVLSPTYDEMRVLCRAFGIHKLTAEDIMEQEAREKVELFRNYYFVNYRTFEQDRKKPDYMEPVNMSFVVFKGGVISFHFSQFPHPALVRRRIRQIREHQLTFADWVSYALIDNITDAYAPIIEEIEQEVDAIDDEILTMHSRDFDLKESKGITDEKAKKPGKKSFYERIAGKSAADASDTDTLRSVKSSETQRDMLLRVGETRKKVMGLYRLLGNKADVIKGLAKRCNEQHAIAPRSDVGLYLGDIQDHIVTMTGNLTHYENILSRAHSNYLAQINVRMNERAEQTNDVLGKLTILGTIVLPMNIVTGLFGSNFPVPGQTSDESDLTWFWWTTAFLAAFGCICYFLARRVYGPL